MKYPFQKSIYSITFLFIVFFSGCHSLPPSEPPDTEQEFDIRGLPWEGVSMPAELLGDWYMGGKIHLTVAEDTLRVQGNWSLIQSIDSADSYYRIIYKIGSMYYSMYLRNLTGDDVQIVHADSTAADEEGVSAIPVTGVWQTLTSTNPWIATGMPVELPGNWHIRDGEMETVIDPESVVVDGEAWEIDSVQTNRTVERLILRSGERYKSLYFQEVGEYTMAALLVDGKEDIQDRHGKVPGDWINFYKWWDLIEKYRLYPGSRWTYEYFYREYYNQVYNTFTPMDSIVQKNNLKGQFELEVTSSTIQDGTGGLTLQATFQIEEENGSYYHVRKGNITEVLTDSSWVNPGHLKTEQYNLSLENDTLWFDTEEGMVFFISAKVHQEALVNLRPFVYPFEFPREGFPEGKDALARIFLSPDEIPPKPDYYGAIWISNDIVVTGLVAINYVYFELGKGFQTTNYFYGDYDQGYWYGRELYLDPYIKETSFKCDLINFTPGQ